jgi:pyruvate ferredoxin oxidoreductase beta subunit/2-oxoisovalerate ferredoxin oxidoreductase beta subunit
MNRPETCLLRPGNTNCGGCGMSTGLTMLGRALEAAGDSCTLVIPACCGVVTAGAYPTTSYGVPVIAATFASAAAMASGVASIRDLNGEPGQVICWAGDGGTYDIGLATVSAAAERNENLIYISPTRRRATACPSLRPRLHRRPPWHRASPVSATSTASPGR